MLSLLSLIGLLGFAAAAILYSLCALVVYLSRPGTVQANFLIAGLVVSAAWAFTVLFSTVVAPSSADWLVVADGAHLAAWVIYLGTVLMGSGGKRSAARAGVAIIVATVIALGVIATATLSLSSPETNSLAPGFRFGGMLALTIFGLFALEQIYRNADFERRHVLRPLSIGIGAIFAIDIFTYSQALLFSGIYLNVWILRGIGNAFAMPFIFLGAKRQPDWSRDLFVSRHVVFYTTSLLAIGIYLLVVGAAGYLVTSANSYWSPLLQVLFLLAAAGTLLYVLFSTTIRTYLRIFIAKHFFRNRYDYREEWLRLIDTLAARSRTLSLPERGVKALADILGSTRGELWLCDRPGEPYRGYGSLNSPIPDEALNSDDVLVRFLKRRGWVVDSLEYLAEPDKYENALSPDHPSIERPSIIVPLFSGNDMIGLARLDRPRGLGELSFEDHDLLKTAGRQVAVFLAQELAQTELAESRQFEAFSKLTAFLMHDLKNLVAQQELIISNANRFRNHPDFFDDAIRTIEFGVLRMRKLLNLLQTGAEREHRSRVDVGRLLKDVRETCASVAPVPVIEEEVDKVFVSIDRDRLSMAIVHAVRNAQDATDPDGRIVLRVVADDCWVVIEISDTGEGMDATFIREQLFRPFQTTKGNKGMGIGAFQIRESIRAAGGDVEVTSAKGKGTLMRLKLPRFDSLESAPGGGPA